MKNNFVVEPTNKLYQKALKREIGIWRRSKQVDFRSETFHAVEFIYNEKKYFFENNQDWIDFFAIFAPFQNALILGGNNTNFEKNLLEKKIVDKIENLDIIFGSDTTNNLNKFNDLNFIDLPENTYDLIIAKSILHHIINLEHLLIQVNKSLTANGILVVFEYCGENKQQWYQKKIDLVNAEFVCEDIIPGYKFDRLKHNYYNDWPFESIRSQEILEVIDEIFNEKQIEVMWGKLNWPIDYHLSQYCFMNKTTLNSNTKIDLKSRIEGLENKYKNNQKLLPSYLFGIYRKNIENININVIKWGKEKIKKELKLNGPLNIRFRSFKNTYQDNPILIYLRKIKKILKRII